MDGTGRRTALGDRPEAFKASTVLTEIFDVWRCVWASLIPFDPLPLQSLKRLLEKTFKRSYALRLALPRARLHFLRQRRFILLFRQSRDRVFLFSLVIRTRGAVGTLGAL